MLKKSLLQELSGPSLDLDADPDPCETLVKKAAERVKACRDACFMAEALGASPQDTADCNRICDANEKAFRQKMITPCWNEFNRLKAMALEDPVRSDGFDRFRHTYWAMDPADIEDRSWTAREVPSCANVCSENFADCFYPCLLERLRKMRKIARDDKERKRLDVQIEIMKGVIEKEKAD